MSAMVLRERLLEPRIGPLGQLHLLCGTRWRVPWHRVGGSISSAAAVHASLTPFGR